jgi:hypothetical protein
MCDSNADTGRLLVDSHVAASLWVPSAHVSVDAGAGSDAHSAAASSRSCPKTLTGRWRSTVRRLPPHATFKLHGACVARVACLAFALVVDLDTLGGWHTMQPGQTKDPTGGPAPKFTQAPFHIPAVESVPPHGLLAWELGRKFGPRHVRTPVVLYARDAPMLTKGRQAACLQGRRSGPHRLGDLGCPRKA